MARDHNDRCFCIPRRTRCFFFFFFLIRESCRRGPVSVSFRHRGIVVREKQLTVLSDRLDDSRFVHAAYDTFSRITYCLMDLSYRDTLIFQLKFLERILRLD